MECRAAGRWHRKRQPLITPSYDKGSISQKAPHILEADSPVTVDLWIGTN